MIDMKYLNRTWLILIAAMMAMTGMNFTEANAQSCTPKWGPDSIQTIQKLSLYAEFYKQKNYDDALPHWRYVFANAPGARQSPFVDGAKMFKALIKKTTDKELKKKYIDTLLMIYDRRMECHGVKADVIGRKAIEMMNNGLDTRETFEEFQKSINMGGNKTAYFILYPYSVAAIKASKAGVVDDGQLIQIYSEVIDIIDYNVKKGGKNTDKFKATQAQIDEAIAGTGVLKCENLKPILQKQYDETPDNQDLWKKIYNQMRAARCATDPLFVEVTKKLYQVEKTPDMARIMAMNMSNSGQTREAITYFKEAIEMESNPETKGEYNMSIAELYYKLKDFASARSYAQKAASLKSGWGNPYLLIGDLYRGSGSKCGSGVGFESQIVTWPAIDMYEKAKAVDPSVASKANRKIADSKKYMPAKTECFFQSLKEGDSFTVKCWINVTTTVRYGPEH